MDKERRDFDICKSCGARKPAALLSKGLCLGCCYQEHQRGITTLNKPPLLQESFQNQDDFRPNSFEWGSRHQPSAPHPDDHYSFNEDFCTRKEMTPIGLPKWDQDHEEARARPQRLPETSPRRTLAQSNLSQHNDSDSMHENQGRTRRELSQWQRDERGQRPGRGLDQCPKEGLQRRKLEDEENREYRKVTPTKRRGSPEYESGKQGVRKERHQRAGEDWARLEQVRRTVEKSRERLDARQARLGLVRQRQEGRPSISRPTDLSPSFKIPERKPVVPQYDRKVPCRQFEGKSPGHRDFDAKGAIQRDYQPKTGRDYQPKISISRDYDAKSPAPRDYQLKITASREYDAKSPGPRDYQSKMPNARDYQAKTPVLSSGYERKRLADRNVQERGKEDRRGQVQSPGAGVRSGKYQPPLGGKGPGQQNRYLHSDWKDGRNERANGPKQNEGVSRFSASEMFKQRQEQRKQKLGCGSAAFTPSNHGQQFDHSTLSRQIQQMRSKLSDYRERLKRE